MDFTVKVITGANRRRIVSGEGGELRVYLKSPPVKGKANEEMIEMLAKHYDVRKSDIEIIRGGRSRNKVVRIAGKRP